MLKLPGLIDVHTHLRVPGGEHKEDFATGTAAALAGGITTVFGMPNTTPPLATEAVMVETVAKAKAQTRCDVGLFAGASPDHMAELASLAPYSIGLKIYLNDTFGTLRVEKLVTLMKCFEVWPRHLPIAMHAEMQSVAVGIAYAATYNRHVHFCHVSRKGEIQLIAAAKKQGLPISCEVAPHHLFMDKRDLDRLGNFGEVRPRLNRPVDRETLWKHIDTTIDCIATDHAPHTVAEKKSATPPPGFAGLETSLPLMLTAVREGHLTMERLIELMYTNPRRIFNLPEQSDTYVEIDPEAQYTISNETMHSRCGWTPFDGQQVMGQVQRVVLRGQTVFENGQILAQPGSGRVLGVTGRE